MGAAMLARIALRRQLRCRLAHTAHGRAEPAAHAHTCLWQPRVVGLVAHVLPRTTWSRSTAIARSPSQPSSPRSRAGLWEQLALRGCDRHDTIGGVLSRALRRGLRLGPGRPWLSRLASAPATCCCNSSSRRVSSRAARLGAGLFRRTVRQHAPRLLAACVVAISMLVLLMAQVSAAALGRRAPARRRFRRSAPRSPRLRCSRASC